MSNALLALHWICRSVLAGVFIYSGYVKARATLQFAVAITGYRLIPDALVFPIAEYFPWVEIALGLLILSGWQIRYVAGAAGALLLFFIALLSTTYARGIEAECGCFGFGEPISPLTLVRDGLFLLPALFLVFEKRLRAGVTPQPTAAA